MLENIATSFFYDNVTAKCYFFFIFALNKNELVFWAFSPQ